MRFCGYWGWEAGLSEMKVKIFLMAVLAACISYQTVIFYYY